jgi:predicted SAM-dependent methyltransferase
MERLIKLNLGSGPSGIEGWINYDWGMLPILGKYPMIRSLMIKIGLLSKDYDLRWPKIKLVDIKKRLPLNDNSVDFIYCSHVLEHFEKWEAEKILKECKRVLKKGGVLRIVLPDLGKLVRYYESADKFCREIYGFDKDKIWGIRKYFIRGHQWMYDVDSFKELLGNASFKKILDKSWRKGKCPDLERLDLELHKDLSLYLEIEK